MNSEGRALRGVMCPKGGVMRLILAMTVSVGTLSCGQDKTPSCEDGFEKKNDRWCVYTEAPLVIPDDAAPTEDELGESQQPEEPDVPEEPTPEPPDESDPVDPTEYLHESDAVEPTLTLSQIEQGIVDAIATVRSIDPAPLHEVYEAVQDYGVLSPRDLMALDDTGAIAGSAGCPNYSWDYYWENQRDYWRDACTVADGGSFSGYAYSYDKGGYLDWDETYEYAGHAYYSGSAKVIDGLGYTFIGAGSSNYYERQRTSTLDWTFYNSINGNFRTDNPLYADTWLARDLNVNMYIYATRAAADDSTYTSLAASISGLDGVVNAVRFEETLLYSEAIGSMCELEPSGKISLRGPEGNWYETEFHGPKYSGAGSFPPDCDSCGTVYFRGQSIGEVCPDFTTLREWERPWL